MFTSIAVNLKNNSSTHLVPFNVIIVAYLKNKMSSKQVGDGYDSTQLV